MAVHQAVEAFRLLTGAQADAARMSRDFLAMIAAAGREAAGLIIGLESLRACVFACWRNGNSDSAPLS